MTVDPTSPVSQGERKNFFEEIVGLRFYLAFWVALGHGFQLAGYHKRDNALLNVVMDGHAAVVVFMIISGFVITNLLQTKAEPYPAYIARRFWRLFPAYLICCVLGYLAFHDWVEIVRHASWSHLPHWPEYAAGVEEAFDQQQRNLAPHVLLHLVMLHGAVPVEVLNRASLTLVPAAWSISLEWQFYLVAPFVLHCLRKGTWTLGLAAASLAALVLFKMGIFGTFQTSSFLLGASPWFAIGIASRLVFERLRSLDSGLNVLAAVLAFWALLIGMRGDEILPLVIWTGFVAMMVWGDRNGLPARLFRGLTTSPPIMLLGEASFSLYLLHRPVQVWIGHYLVETHAVGQVGMLIGQIAAIGVAIPLSVLMYLTVEKYGMHIGRTVAQRLGARGAPIAHPQV